MTESRIRTLVLYAGYTSRLSYYLDWLEAFAQAPELDNRTVDLLAFGARKNVERRVAEVDLVVLLHSTNADTMAYVDPYRDLLQRRRGKLLCFVGNELNLPSSPLAPKISFLRDVEADFVATQLPLEAGEWLYESCSRSRIIALPHALNPQRYRPTIPHRARPIDIGTRSAAYNIFVGDDERNRIIDFFATHPFNPPLRVDISTGHRFDQGGWATFLKRCKGTIATEAGTWYLEADDRTMQTVRDYLSKRQDGRLLVRTDSGLRRLGRYLPASVRRAIRGLGRGLLADENSLNTPTDYADVYENVFRHRGKAPVYSKCISSRHFEAIGTQTCQIMFPGRYNGILRADEHYIPLAKDFSNIDETLRKFQDDDCRERLVSRAYDYVMDQHTYQHRIAELARIVME